MCMLLYITLTSLIIYSFSSKLNKMELREILEILKSFLSPTSNIGQTNLANISIADILNQIIVNFKCNQEVYYNRIEAELGITAENDILWKICRICLKLLLDLTECQFERNENNCYLSIADDRLVATACEFICCFGIHYNLEENIGIPIEKLSRFGMIVKQKRENMPLSDRNERLNECMIRLYEMKHHLRDHVNVVGVFYVKHLHSILCALVQLVHSPNKSCNEEVFIKWLETDLFNEIDGATLVRSLMMTQGIEKFIKVPPWFISATSDLLTKCVLRPNSVVNIIKAILEEVDVSKTTESANDWKKCDLIARILAKCPRKLTAEAYIQHIAPQIVSLLHSIDETKPTKHLIRVSGSIYSLFAQTWPELTRTHLTKQLIHPFNFENSIERSIEAENLLQTLKLLHLVFCTSTEPNWLTMKQLDESLVHLVFQIYCTSLTRPTCKLTAKLCEDLIRNYVNFMESEDDQIQFLTLLLECSILNTPEVNTCPYCLNIKLSIQCENVIACDKVCIKVKEDGEDVVPSIKHVEERCNSIIKIIKRLNTDSIQIDYLFHLFTKLNSYISQQITKTTTTPSKTEHQTDSTFLQLENKIVNIETQLNAKILYLTQISLYLESLDADLLMKNYLKLISLCKLVLENVVNLISLNEDDVSVTEQIIQNEQEICATILNILTLFTSEFIECSYEVKQELYKLLPCIEKLKDVYVNHTELSSLIEMLRISIGTYGAVRTEPVKTTKLIEEMVYEQNSFEQVLAEFGDAMIPVRGHSLILLRQLIERNDAKCQEQADKVYEMILDGLKSTDSYIYLAAINCLIAYAARNTTSRNILNVLLDEYLKNSSKMNENDRLKLGEVIMKLIRNLNDLVPYYGDRLISVFLLGCKSDDELIRASSLSNLGETCKLLNYKISLNLNEIINCIVSILETDRSIGVRRSAMLVVKLLFEGLSKDSFISVIGESLLSLYRTLKKILADYRQDEVVTLHAQLAYEYLDELMKSYLFPKQNLVKEIKILNP